MPHRCAHRPTCFTQPLIKISLSRDSRLFQVKNTNHQGLGDVSVDEGTCHPSLMTWDSQGRRNKLIHTEKFLNVVFKNKN